jgi:DNA processing protein
LGGDILNTLYYYWLTTSKGIGIKKARQILEYFGDIQSVWEGGINDLLKIGNISKQVAENLIKRRDKGLLLKEINNIKAKNIDIICIEDDLYPENLKNIYDPPLIIYTKGNIKKCRKYIAIVGSRRCSLYGKMVARNISKLLCQYDIGIVSGMARGIDTEAHLGAIDGNGFTIAVLGNGPDIVYPPENIKVMQMIENTGAIISEYPPGYEPTPYNFPARNRIISGICHGILVVEAGEKSGALITASYALEEGRDVFAIPGNILSESSIGTNKLIKDGAKTVTDISDILYEFGIDLKEQISSSNIELNLSTKEKMIIDIIGNSPMHIDDLIKKTQLKVSEINSLLTCLELKKIIKIIPGRYIARII